MAYLADLRSSRRTLLVAAALLGAAACNTAGQQSEPADGVFIGRSGELMIAVVAADDLVTAYVCDGRDAGINVNTWFHGQLDGGAGTLSAPGGAEVDLTIADGQLTAEFDDLVAGATLTGAAVTGDTAGLYWGQTPDWLGGWIIADDGQQRGAVLKRNTGDASFVGIQPSQTEVTLPDQTRMPIARMTAPQPVE